MINKLKIIKSFRVAKIILKDFLENDLIFDELLIFWRDLFFKASVCF